jgi:hypothetical protein
MMTMASPGVLGRGLARSNSSSQSAKQLSTAPSLMRPCLRRPHRTRASFTRASNHRPLQELLAETGQELPGWLQNIATRHAPYGQKSGRRGGGRFGGRDFRKDFGGAHGCEFEAAGGAAAAGRADSSSGGGGRLGCRDFEHRLVARASRGASAKTRLHH